MLRGTHLSWAAKIARFANVGQGHKGLLLFQQLQTKGVDISRFLLSAVVKACGTVQALTQGREAHVIILKSGYHTDVVLMTALIDMYSKCNRIECARLVFNEIPIRDVTATNVMILGLCRSGRVFDACQLFDEMSERDEATWNSLISGLAHRNSKNGGAGVGGLAAISLFKEMQAAGDKRPQLSTMVTILSVCADMAALFYGKQIHACIINLGLALYTPVGNAVIHMYAKCGSMEEACRFFDTMPFKNVFSWTTLIVGYGKHGLGKEALQAFDEMASKGVVPNNITFVGTLSACSHAGLVQQGWRNFNSMIHTYSITPMMEHYTCMVDLLARSGHLEEAYEFITKMPVEPDTKLWTAFLRSCCFYMNHCLVRIVGKKLLESNPQDGGPYVLLSNFYGVVGDWEGVAKIRRLMLDRGIRKESAYSWIQIDRTIHTFESGDRSHPMHKEIHLYLNRLMERITSMGYVPNTRIVFQNVGEKMKEEILWGHSEKLAIGFGLMSTPPGVPIKIMKNLRVCMDCHAAIKLISKMEGREIIARDASRFHRFKDGVCSCKDCW